MNLDSIKRFALGIVKIACGVTLAALIIAVAGWAVVSLRQRSEATRNEPLATPRAWSELKIASLETAKFHLQTAWRNGRIYYQFNMDGYPRPIGLAREQAARVVFTINFLDKDGFKLFEHRLTLTESAPSMGADGKTVGLSWKGDVTHDADSYRRASKVDLSWSGLPTVEQVNPAVVASPPVIAPDRSSANAPKLATRPRWRDVTLWRDLTRGASKDEVRQILGEPEKVIEYGAIDETVWYYGYPGGGELTFFNGVLSSWSEP